MHRNKNRLESMVKFRLPPLCVLSLGGGRWLGDRTYTLSQNRKQEPELNRCPTLCSTVSSAASNIQSCSRAHRCHSNKISGKPIRQVGEVLVQIESCRSIWCHCGLCFCWFNALTYSALQCCTNVQLGGNQLTSSSKTYCYATCCITLFISITQQKQLDLFDVL